MLELVVEGWTQLAEMLGMGPDALTVAIGVGGAIYGAVYGCWYWIQWRIADPVSGSSLLGLLGIRNPENRVMRGTVTKVIDGNTLEIGGSRVVRLIGIEAPENTKNDKLRSDAKKTGIRPSQIVEQGRRARQWLSQEIKGKTVELELDPHTSDRDRHGQTLAHVWTVDGRDRKGIHLGEMIVWEGHAVPRDERHAHRKRVDDARVRARRAGRGGNLGVPTGPSLPDITCGQSEDDPVTTSDLGIFSFLNSTEEESQSTSEAEGRARLDEGIQNSQYWRPEE